MSTFRCNSCSKLAANMGAAVRILQGKHQRVCSSCAPTLPQGPRTKKKAIVANDKFTHDKWGQPVGTAAFLGYDYRYQAGPKEQKYILNHGSFMSEWRKLRGKP